MGIDILVPVLGRPWNAQPLVDSITANTTSPHRIVFICSPDDEEQYQACKDTGQETWIIGWSSGKANYARKINWAFAQTQNEWVFTGADDIRFSPQWDAKAFKFGRRYSVLGTNDLHNPGVKRGTHATHILFRRDYVERYGGTFDNSGAVFSEAYDHQWVDNEFILTAQKRKEWHFVKQSVVEHFHPHWGNAEWDDTYRKSVRASRQDRNLFARRVRQLERVLGR